MDSVPEIWKAAMGFEGHYEVSSLGRVKSLRRKVPNGRGSYRVVKERIMALTPNHRLGGYLYVTLYCENKSKSFSVHTLIAKSFLGMPPDGKEVNHIDGNKANCALSNLEYVTSAENKQHARTTGLWQNRGEQHGNTKVSEDQASAMLAMYRDGMKLSDIGRKFGVTKGCVWNVTSGKSWRHLGVAPVKKNRRYSAEAIENAMEMRRRGVTWREIISASGVDHSVVANYLKARERAIV